VVFQSDRGWGERNGLDSSDWGLTSPRKEYALDRGGGSGGSGGGRTFATSGGAGAGAETNWRRQRAMSEDDDGWRMMGSPSSKEKWPAGGQRSSWRDSAGDRDPDDAGRGLNRTHRMPWEQSALPEW